MNAETIELKKVCLKLIREYDESIRALFAKIEPDLMAHAKLTNESLCYIDVDDISIDPIGIYYKVSGNPWYDKTTFYLPWTHFNINR